MIEQVSVQAVGGIIEVALVRANETGRYLEGLTGGKIGFETVAVAGFHMGAGRRIMRRDSHAPNAPLPAKVNTLRTARINNRQRDVIFALRDADVLAVVLGKQIVVNADGVRNGAVISDVPDTRILPRTRNTKHPGFPVQKS